MAGPNTQSKNYDALVTTTVEKYVNTKLADNITDNLVLFKWLEANGQKQESDGGIYMTEPLMYAQNATVGSFSGYDTVNIGTTDGITAATFNYKMYAGSVVMSLEEKLKNSGPSAVISLLQARIKQLELGFQTKLNSDAYLDGTGNSGKDITGLAAMIAATGTYAGIDRSTSDWWRAKVDDQTAANGGTGKVLDVASMVTQFNNQSIGTDTPDIALTSQALFEKYESLLQSTLRYTSPKMGDLGFQSLMFKNIPIVFDRSCQSNRMYFLNSKYIKYRPHKGADFQTQEQVKPNNQLAYYWQVVWMGNLTCNNCRMQGMLLGYKAA